MRPISARERSLRGEAPRRALPGGWRGALGAAVLVLVAAGCASGQRPVAREIVWEGSVLVRGDVTIAPGETLVIRPGTRVSFAFRDADADGACDARIVVRGAVRAVGTAAAPIVFAPEHPGASPGWTEIFLDEAERADFAWCRFSGARQALHSHLTPLVVERCLFERNEVGLRFRGDPVVVRGNRFVGNGTAVRFWESSPEIAGNDFEGNATAVFVREGSARTVLTGNNFAAGADYHVKLGEAQPADVLAQGNWWGTTQRERIEELIYDRADADYIGRVRYDPPAPAPLPRAAP